MSRTDPARMHAAINSPRCAHTRMDGEPCNQPAIRGARFCRFHGYSRVIRRMKDLPVIEDASSVQLALMWVLRALRDRTVDPKTCDTKSLALMLYGLQIASANLKRLDLVWHPPAATDAQQCAREESLAELLLKELHAPQPDDDDEDNADAGNGELPADDPRRFTKTPGSVSVFSKHSDQREESAVMK